MKKYGNFLLRITISLIILGTIIYYFDTNIFNAISQINNYNYILVALLIPLFIIPIISNNRWKLFLNLQGISEKFFTLVKINFISNFLGFLLPSSTGYDAIRMFMIEKRHKNKLGAGGASVIIERLLGFYLLSLMGVVGAIVAYNKGTEVGILFIAIFINAFISLVLILFKIKKLYKWSSNVLSRINKLKKTINYLDKLYAAINSFPINRTMFFTILLIFLFQLSCIICVFLIFKAFNTSISFYHHLAFLPLILILSIVPISISGFGIREGGFVYFYGLIGINGGISLLASLLYYSVLVLVPVTIGMILYIFGEAGLKKDNLSKLKIK